MKEARKRKNSLVSRKQSSALSLEFHTSETVAGVLILHFIVHGSRLPLLHIALLLRNKFKQIIVLILNFFCVQLTAATIKIRELEKGLHLFPCRLKCH